MFQYIFYRLWCACFFRQFNRFIDQRKQFSVLFIDLVDARQTILRKFVHYYVPPSVYFLCENKSSFLPLYNHFLELSNTNYFYHTLCRYTIKYPCRHFSIIPEYSKLFCIHKKIPPISFWF